jgi:hypothetical protein
MDCRARPGTTLNEILDDQSRIGRAPGAQLLRLALLGLFEIIVGLHEKEPGTLPIADRVCLF